MNSIHTDIAISVDAALIERFAFLEAAGLPVSHPQAKWLVFGWGSRTFYIATPTWAELKPGPLAAALTVDSTAMHTLVRGELDVSDPSVSAFSLSENSYQELLDFIDAGFARGADGQPIPIADAAYGPDDSFFEATGWFNVLIGCNTWTAAALRAGGLRTGRWNPLPLTLGWSLSLYNEVPGSQP